MWTTERGVTMRGMLCRLAVVSVFMSPGAALAADVTFGTLLAELTDLDRLTRFPDPVYTCRQFSSYDRRSTDPAVPTEENWFANHDRGQHLRGEEGYDGRAEWVLMDAEGPGAIVRFWSANPWDGDLVRIYLDGAETPAIEAPLADLLGGKTPLAPAPIGGVRGKGWNSYLPIPYAKHCKVTTTAPDYYYLINYRTYAGGTSVETYSKEVAARHAADLARAAEALAKPDQARAAADADERTLVLATGVTERITLEGPGAIRLIEARVEAGDPARVLRGVVLRIAFDGQPASVVAPLGDFFGTAPGVNPFRGLPGGARPDGTLYSHWVMPYAGGAEITFTNETGPNTMISLRMAAAPRAWTEDSLHFHAKWHGERQIPTRPMRDWNYLSAEGKGRFAGVMLHIANPVPDWWGEGDEKIYVDGETFPSHFGTGTEDYFGYAWCDTAIFSHAFHNQPRCDGPANFGHTSVNRFHLVDDIPFNESIKFDMELWHWADTKVDQSVVAYWYAAPGATDRVPPIDRALLSVPALPDAPEARRVPGAIEGEFMEVIEATGGATARQYSGVWDWSGNEQLWWMDAAPGDTLTLAFTAPGAGRRSVVANLTRAPDYGIAVLRLNGLPLAGPIDFYHGHVEAAEITLGEAEILEGENRLTIEITGTNPEAHARHMFGLDYLILRPVD